MSIRQKLLGSLKDRRPQHKDDPPIFDGVPCSNLVYKMGPVGPGTINGPVITLKKEAFSLGLTGVISISPISRANGFHLGPGWCCS